MRKTDLLLVLGNVGGIMRNNGIYTASEELIALGGRDLIKAIDNLISFANEKVETREGRKDRYTFAGASYFKRMQELGLYSVDIDEITDRIKKLNLDNIFEQKLV